jgi:hypothetical protein
MELAIHGVGMSILSAVREAVGGWIASAGAAPL